MATTKQKKAFTFLSENIRNPKPIPLGQLLIKAGYSIRVAEKPKLVTESKGFQELLEEQMPDDLLTSKHVDLMETKRIEHMVFPLGPAGEDDANLSGAKPNAANDVEKAGVKVERTTLTDQEIKEMIADIGGTVRRIVHGQTARHVYYWSPDGKLQLDALKLAYAIKGKMAAADDGRGQGNTYNNFVQQNNININAPKARELADETLKLLMEKTKRKVVDNTTATPDK